MSSSAPSLRPPPPDMTRVRPPGMEVAAPARSSGRVSVPAAGEINRKVRRKRSGMLALYWAAGIVAMLTAGGIVIAMIARGDADALMQRQNATPAQVVVAKPSPAAAAPIVPASAAPVVAEAPAVAKEPAKKMTAIPGAKPGQIVDLQLWKGRAASSGSGSTATAAQPPNTNTNAPAAAPTSTTKSTVSTPDNDPAVRLARDQLESTFK